jgi:hypothetical protein
VRSTVLPLSCSPIRIERQPSAVGAEKRAIPQRRRLLAPRHQHALEAQAHGEVVAARLNSVLMPGSRHFILSSADYAFG